MKRSLQILTLMLLPVAFAAGQSSGKPDLTVEKIMQDPVEWVGSLPDNIYWNDNGEWIYFNRNPENKARAPLYRVSPEGGQPQKLSLRQEKSVPASRGSYDREQTRKVYVKNGDLFLYHIGEGTIRKLVNGKGRIQNPAFTHDEGAITFTMEGNLWKYKLKEDNLKLLAVFKSGSDREKKEPANQHDQWLRQQQKQLFEVIRRENRKEETLDSIRKAMEPAFPKTIYTGRGSATNIRLSPGQRFITYNVYQRGKRKSTEVPHFVTETGYTEGKKTRAKVGGDHFSYGLEIYDTRRDTGYSVVTPEIPGIKDQPEFLKEYGNYKENPEPREVYIYGPYWSDNGKHALISVRSDDNKDRWLMLLDPATGKPELLNRQHDEAWLGGPGISRWGEELGWMPDNRHIWFQSEASGYSHLYTVNIQTGKKKQLTSGEYEIYDPRISKDEEHWYFSANKVHPGERHFYRMPLEGGKMTRLTGMEGRNDAYLSPDEEYIAIRHSYANKPWELYVKENDPDARPVQITHSLTDQFKAYPWRDPEIVTFEARDGANVPARLYRPEDAPDNGPAVIFVHGAGYLQNAHKWWSNYFREYMFHNLLVDQGYTVLDIDYRGSAGYGRDWRTAIYRHMGGKDLTDQVDGARYLVEKHGVDSDRIGIYGGSYGGFITLMGLFKNADTFAAGAALRSVTDWAHYNHSYTSNILNEPARDSIAYRRSSPIYFAEGLEDPLLICHGMVDHNVHFQDVVRLSQRLIEMGKEDWEMAVYPVEPHSFKYPSSWTDEYRRIYELFEEHLK